MARMRPGVLRVSALLICISVAGVTLGMPFWRPQAFFVIPALGLSLVGLLFIPHGDFRGHPLISAFGIGGAVGLFRVLGEAISDSSRGSAGDGVVLAIQGLAYAGFLLIGLIWIRRSRATRPE